mgnify:FL=1
MPRKLTGVHGNFTYAASGGVTILAHVKAVSLRDETTLFPSVEFGLARYRTMESGMCQWSMDVEFQVFSDTAMPTSGARGTATFYANDTDEPNGQGIAGEVSWTGTAWIENIEIKSSFDGDTSGTATLQGDGALTPTPAPTGSIEYY